MRVAGLFGGHVPDRAEHDAGFGHLLRREPREAEVEHLRLPVRGHQHVARLDVAVHQPVAVRLAERVGHLAEQFAGPQRGERPAVPDQREQVLAGDQLHHEVLARLAPGPGVPARVETGHDVRVLEPGDGPGLAIEPVNQARADVRRARHHL